MIERTAVLLHWDAGGTSVGQSCQEFYSAGVERVAPLDGDTWCGRTDRFCTCQACGRRVYCITPVLANQHWLSLLLIVSHWELLIPYARLRFLGIPIVPQPLH